MQEGPSLEEDFAVLTPNELLTNSVPELRELVSKRREQNETLQGNRSLAAMQMDGAREARPLLRSVWHSAAALCQPPGGPAPGSLPAERWACGTCNSAGAEQLERALQVQKGGRCAGVAAPGASPPRPHQRGVHLRLEPLSPDPGLRVRMSNAHPPQPRPPWLLRLSKHSSCMSAAALLLGPVRAAARASQHTLQAWGAGSSPTVADARQYEAACARDSLTSAAGRGTPRSGCGT